MRKKTKRIREPKPLPIEPTDNSFFGILKYAVDEWIHQEIQREIASLGMDELDEDDRQLYKIRNAVFEEARKAVSDLLRYVDNKYSKTPISNAGTPKWQREMIKRNPKLINVFSVYDYIKENRDLLLA